MKTILDVYIHPFLQNLGLYTPPDPTYGRYLLEVSGFETALEANKEIKVTSRRVFLDNLKGENVFLTPSELDAAKKREWVYYKIWQQGPGNGCDVVLLHGVNDYSGKWAAHISSLLEKGFRVIAPDFPSHGRSTGLHVYIATADQLMNSVEAVLVDVDSFSDVKRKIFLVGNSMGGGVVFNYCAGHPGGKRIAGAYGISPMIGIAPETMPHPLVQRAARILQFFSGRLPFAKAVRGNVSDDPRVEAEFLADPRGYHGDLRIATGLALLSCLSYLTPSVSASFTTPLRIIHGNHDRVTSHLYSLKFVEAAGSKDKSVEIFEGYEHVMLKVGIDKKDDEQRQRTLADLETWLLQRV